MISIKHFGRVVFCSAIFLLCSWVIISCGDDDMDYRPAVVDYGAQGDDYVFNIPFDTNQEYLCAKMGEKYWIDSVLNMAYCKVDNMETPSWFDIMIDDKNQSHFDDTIKSKYLFVHIDNSLATKFSIKDSMVFDSGFKVIYYENRKDDNAGSTFDLYLQNGEGRVVVKSLDGENISGYFVGEMKNMINDSDIRSSKIYFNKIPVSVAKKERNKN